VTQNEIIYQLSPEEFFFLSHMMQITNIAGFDDPYRGYLVTELEDQFEEVKAELIKKGYLLKGLQSGTYDIDEILGIYLAVCASDKVIYVKKNVDKVQNYEAYLYFTPSLVVERTQNEIGQVVLSHVADLELSLDILHRFLPLTLRSELEFSVDIDTMTWEEWTSFNAEKMVDTLVGKGCLMEEATLAIDTIYHASRSGSMVYWQREGYKWYQEGYHYAQNNSHMYLILELDENAIRIEAYTPEVVKASLERFSKLFDSVQGGV